MIPRNSPIEWVPVKHVSPRPRIDNPLPRWFPPDEPVNHVKVAIDAIEAKRIWALIVEVSR